MTKISADKHSIKKGDGVNVSWSSDLPDSLVLVIDDGNSVQRIQVPDSGSRICWSNNARHEMNFTIIAVCNGKKETDSVKVKVKGTSGKTGSKEAGIGKISDVAGKDESQNKCRPRPTALSMDINEEVAAYSLDRAAGTTSNLVGNQHIQVDMDYYQLFDMERELSMLMSRVKIGEMIDEASTANNVF